MSKRKNQGNNGGGVFGGVGWLPPQPNVTHGSLTGPDDNNLYDYRNRPKGDALPSRKGVEGEARAAVIRELPGAELEAFCTPAELAGEVSRRWYFAQMNPKELEFQATFDLDAAAELKRRNGELPR